MSGCTCRGSDGPCEECIAAEQLWREEQADKEPPVIEPLPHDWLYGGFEMIGQLGHTEGVSRQMAEVISRSHG